MKHGAGIRICMTTGSDAFTDAPLSIKPEVAIAQNCLREAAIAAGRDSTGEVKELLVNAKSVRGDRIPAVTSEIPFQFRPRKCLRAKIE
jgi:hypothetical protein